MNLRWIQRVDNFQKYSHCWKVAVKRQNVTKHKYFSDNGYGSKSLALEAAIAYRNALLQEISGVGYLLWRRELKRPNNTSGIVGVGRYVARSKKYQTGCPYWQASWRDADGKRHSRTFTINQYGEDGAKERACKARRKGLIELEKELKIRLEERLIKA